MCYNDNDLMIMMINIDFLKRNNQCIMQFNEFLKKVFLNFLVLFVNICNFDGIKNVKKQCRNDLLVVLMLLGK